MEASRKKKWDSLINRYESLRGRILQAGVSSVDQNDSLYKELREAATEITAYGFGSIGDLYCGNQNSAEQSEDVFTEPVQMIKYAISAMDKSSGRILKSVMYLKKVPECKSEISALEDHIAKAHGIACGVSVMSVSRVKVSKELELSKAM